MAADSDVNRPTFLVDLLEQQPVPAGLDDEGLAASSMLTFSSNGFIILSKEWGKLNISAFRSVNRGPTEVIAVQNQSHVGIVIRIDINYVRALTVSLDAIAIIMGMLVKN